MSAATLPLPETAPARDNLSLYEIERDLQELMAAYSEAEADEATRQAIERGIREYLEREIRKVDGVRAYLLHCEHMAQGAAAEAERQMARAAEWTRRANRLKQGCAEAMGAFGVKRLEGRTGRLSLKGNGGPAPLEVADETRVPDELCKAEISMPWTLWIALRIALDDLPDAADKWRAKRSVSNSAIRAQLEAPCWLCGGSDSEACPQCGGTGLTPVPGARLVPRGQHLEVK